MTYKQDHEPDDDLELQKLLTTSDEELLTEARDEGIDVPALVSAMRKRIAQKLRHAAQRVPPVSNSIARGMAEKEWVRTPEQSEAPGLRVALDPDIAGLELETISYLAVLQHNWDDGKVSAVEQEYRGWLQVIRNLPDRSLMDAAITPSADCHRYWECHIRHGTLYLKQTTALFGTALLRWPDGADSGSPQLDEDRRPAASTLEVVTQLCEQAASIEVRPDWEAGTVHVDDGNRHFQGSPRPATRSCARCTAHAIERVLGDHVTRLPGVAMMRRILVHHVEMDQCGQCGDSRLTLDGRIKAERCTHRAIVFLREQDAERAGPSPEDK